tara:strand:+ start:207 stop:452 length:246 start_codon:yes stop_codon:yes gene_type:complete
VFAKDRAVAQRHLDESAEQEWRSMNAMYECGVHDWDWQCVCEPEDDILASGVSQESDDFAQEQLSEHEYMEYLEDGYVVVL